MANKGIVENTAPIWAAPADAPICVDLDGTLVKTDTLAEALLALVKNAPWCLFLLPFWLVRGRAYFKHEIARRSPLDIANLPYRSELINFLIAEKKAGRRIVLATGADNLIAQQVARHLKLFDDVLASNGRINLTGRKKLQALEAGFRSSGFKYAGNASADIPIWRCCDEAILVDVPYSVSRRLQREPVVVDRTFRDRRSALMSFLRAIRIHQWAKNILLFVPLVCAHQLFHPQNLLSAAVAFISFSLCASSVYVINDLADLQADRRHAQKRDRPFASGALPLLSGFLMIPSFLAAGFLLALRLPVEFAVTLSAYLVLTLLYSFHLKKVPLLDVILLAGFYTIRIIAGGTATHIVISHWLLGFALFFFLSLALVKRTSELHSLRKQNHGAMARRGYLTKDLEQLASFGTSSGYLAVLVLALYLNSPDARDMYAKPQIVWAICPVLIYWISRMWLLTHRGQMQDDPVLFALKDKVSYFLGGLAILILLLAT